MDDKRVLKLLDYVRAHGREPAIIQTKIDQCVQAIEWAKQAHRWDWIIEFANVLLNQFIFTYSRSPVHGMQEQDVEHAKSFWEQVRFFATQGLLAARQAGDQKAESGFVGELARVAGYLNDYEMAVDCLRQKASLVESYIEKLGVARNLALLGNRANGQKNFLAARACYQASLEIQQMVGNKAAMANTLDLMAVNETERFESGATGGEQFDEHLPFIIKSLWELSDALRQESKLVQAEGEEATSDADTLTYNRLQDTLTKLNSLT